MASVTASAGFQLSMDASGNIKYLDSYWSAVTPKVYDSTSFMTSLIYSDQVNVTYSIDVGGSIAFNAFNSKLTAHIGSLSLLANGAEVLSITDANVSVIGAERLPLSLFLNGDDLITGSLLDDVIRGLSGNDSLYGDLGNDFLDGGTGIDAAFFNFDQAQGSVLFAPDRIIVTGPDGRDELVNIENIVFLNGQFDDPLVDQEFYGTLRPDILKAGWNLDIHYNVQGWREGSDPNQFFSTNGYLSANADVRAAGLNPLEHYRYDGWREGRDASVNFDTDLYLLANPDVAAVGINPLAHFLQYGQHEGRSAFTAVGRSIQNGFDREYYLLANPDVGAAGADAALHFDTYGWREGRDPNAFFDTSDYLSTYKDVAAAGINPLEHYMTWGWKEGRDPSGSFDSSSYLAAYLDVAASGMNPLQHYLQYGLYEGRLAFGDGFIG